MEIIDLIEMKGYDLFWYIEREFSKCETMVQVNRNIKNIFLSFFLTERIKQMKEILEKGRYVPQEILNISDF